MICLSCHARECIRLLDLTWWERCCQTVKVLSELGFVIDIIELDELFSPRRAGLVFF